MQVNKSFKYKELNLRALWFYLWYLGVSHQIWLLEPTRSTSGESQIWYRTTWCRSPFSKYGRFAAEWRSFGWTNLFHDSKDKMRPQRLWPLRQIEKKAKVHFAREQVEQKGIFTFYGHIAFSAQAIIIFNILPMLGWKCSACTQA